MIDHIIKFSNNVGSTFYIDERLVDGFNIHHKPDMIIGSTGTYDLKLYVKETWWLIGSYSSLKEAEDYGMTILKGGEGE